MKKKLILSLLVAVLSVNLIACGQKEQAPQENTASKIEETVNDDNQSQDEDKDTSKNEVKNDEKAAANQNTTETNSSLSSLLNFGQTGIASKLTDSSNSNVNVSLDNITRGDAANSIVEKYNSEDHGVEISPLEGDTVEYAVVNYTLTIPDSFPHDEYGPNGEIATEICGTDGEGLNYNGILYCVNTWNMYDCSDVLKPNIPYKASFVFQIPKGCTDYVIKVGEYDGTKAFFKGK